MIAVLAGSHFNRLEMIVGKDSDSAGQGGEANGWGSIVIVISLIVFVTALLALFARSVARPRRDIRTTRSKVWNSRPPNSQSNEPVKRRFATAQLHAAGEPISAGAIDRAVELMGVGEAHIQGRGAGTMQDRHFVATSWLRGAVRELVTNPSETANAEFVRLLGLINPALRAMWNTIYGAVTAHARSWNRSVRPAELQQFLDDLQNSELNRAIWDTDANQRTSNRPDISEQLALQHEPDHARQVGLQWFKTSSALGFRPTVGGSTMGDDITAEENTNWRVAAEDMPISPRELLGFRTWLIAYLRELNDRFWQK
ncbi:hypothetical protein ACFPME_02010 [Rhodanobacter umsongensis]|uniref:DUF1517 domain-containing protein n=1 Tax=Rhodanobacter umsongensis TaxID=633153 RepID=A0ABW0JHA4_9GAMM